MTVTGSDILSNTTGNQNGYGDGAGIELYDTFCISGTQIVSNTALYDNDDDSGGGLAAYGYDRGYIPNSVLPRNSARYGGGLHLSPLGPHLTRTSFPDNFSPP